MPVTSQQSSQVTLTKSDRGSGFSRFSLLLLLLMLLVLLVSRGASAAVLLYYREKENEEGVAVEVGAEVEVGLWAVVTVAQAARCAGAPSDT